MSVSDRLVSWGRARSLAVILVVFCTGAIEASAASCSVTISNLPSSASYGSTYSVKVSFSYTWSSYNDKPNGGATVELYEADVANNDEYGEKSISAPSNGSSSSGTWSTSVWFYNVDLAGIGGPDEVNDVLDIKAMVEIHSPYIDDNWYSSEYDRDAVPSVPSSITVPSQGTTDGKCTVSWGSSTGKDDYELQEKDGSSGTWSAVYTGTSTSKQRTGLTQGHTYYYRVRGRNSSSSSAWREGGNGCSIPMTPPGIPSSISVPSSDSDGSYSVSWGSADRATSYELQERDGPSASWNTVYTGENRSKSLSGRDVGHGYYYRVRASNSAGDSGWREDGPCVVGSTGCGVTISELPSEAHYGQSYSNIVVSVSYVWVAANDRPDGGATVELYEADVADNDEYGSKSLGAPGGASSDYGVWSTSTTFNAIDLAGIGGPDEINDVLDIKTMVEIHSPYIDDNWYSSEYNRNAVPTVPSSITVPSQGTAEGSCTVSWGTSTGKDDYELQERDGSSGSWSTVYTGTSTSKQRTGLTQGHTYYYRVRGTNSSSSSAWREGSNGCSIPVTPPDPPSSISVPSSDSDGSYSVSWGSADRATSYELQERDGPSASWNTVYTGENRSKSLSGRDVGHGYYYRVRASNSAGDSGWREDGPCVVGSTGCGVTISELPSEAHYGQSYSNIVVSVSYVWVAANDRPDGGATVELYEADVADNDEYGSKSLGAPGGASSDYGVWSTSTTFNAIDLAGIGGPDEINDVLDIKTMVEIHSPYIDDNWYSSEYNRNAVPTVPSSITVPSQGTAEGSCTVSWGTSTGKDDYELQERDGSSGSWSTVYTGKSTSKQRTGLTQGHTYYYRVRGTNSSSSSAWREGGNGCAVPIADLVVAAVWTEPALPSELGEYVMKARIRNDGGAVASAGQGQQIEWTLSTAGEEVATGSFGDLGVEAEITVSSNALVAPIAGTYSLQAQADPSNTVPESNDVANNQLTTPDWVVAEAFGSLDVTVKNWNGETVSGAEVVLYRQDESEDWIGFTGDRLATNDEGIASFSELRVGNYNLEAYYNGEFWVGKWDEDDGHVTIVKDETEPTELFREEPFGQSPIQGAVFEAEVKGTSNDVLNDNISPGTTVTLSVNVTTTRFPSRKARVAFYVSDAMVDGQALYSEPDSGETVVWSTWETFARDYTCASSGIYYLRFDVESWVNNRWIKTDSWPWSAQRRVIVNSVAGHATKSKILAGSLFDPTPDDPIVSIAFDDGDIPPGQQLAQVYFQWRFALNAYPDDVVRMRFFGPGWESAGTVLLNDNTRDSHASFDRPDFVDGMSAQTGDWGIELEGMTTQFGAIDIQSMEILVTYFDAPLNKVPLEASDSSKVIVLVHGWNPSARPAFDPARQRDAAYDSSYHYDEKWQRLEDALSHASEEADGWDVVKCDWALDAATGPIVNMSDGVFHPSNPWQSKDSAIAHGLHLGEEIAAKYPELKKVHLIAHSAGNWVGRGALRYLRDQFPDALFQFTSLDAFIPVHTTLSSRSSARTERAGIVVNSRYAFEEITRWGDRGRIFLDNYYVDDSVPDPLNPDWPTLHTQERLTGWNINRELDIPFNNAPLYESSMHNHGGPVEWYAATVEAYNEPDQQGLTALVDLGFKSSLLYRELSSKPPPPAPVSPRNGTHVGSLSPTLTWTDFVPASTGQTQLGYQLRVATASGSGEIVYNTGFIADTDATSHVYSVDGFAGTDAATGDMRVSNALQWNASYRWQARYFGSGQIWSDWSPLEGGGFVVADTVLPGNVGNLNPSSHSTGVWSRNRDVQISWTGAVDAQSGVDGYSVLWSHSSDSVPDDVKDIEEAVSTATGAGLADAPDWYFHIRARDNVGNWADESTGVARIGPFKIDRTAPESSHGLNGNQVTLTAQDSTSGIDWIRYRINGGRGWTEHSGGEVSFGVTGGDLVEYYARDNAGNEESTHSFTVGGGNASPTAVITSILPSPADPQTDTVAFREDSRDNDESGNSIVGWEWRSNLGDWQGNAVLSRSAEPDIPAADLAVGTHNITLSVTDDEGDGDAVSTTLTVSNVSPVIDTLIVQATRGDEISVSGAAHDRDERENSISGWLVEVAGPDGPVLSQSVSGASLSYAISKAGFGNGDYTVTAKAQDDEGSWSEAVTRQFALDYHRLDIDRDGGVLPGRDILYIYRALLIGDLPLPIVPESHRLASPDLPSDNEIKARSWSLANAGDLDFDGDGRCLPGRDILYMYRSLLIGDLPLPVVPQTHRDISPELPVDNVIRARIMELTE